jgi:hypothetical protein
VLASAGDRHDGAGARDRARHRAAGALDVEGELAAAHAVELERIVAVEHRWPAARLHEHLEDEEITAALVAGEQEIDAFASDGLEHREALSGQGTCLLRAS